MNDVVALAADFVPQGSFSQQHSAETESVVPGSFLARIMALLIDVVIIFSLLFGCLVIPMASLQHGEFSLELAVASFFLSFAIIIFSPMLSLFYFVLFHGILGQTVGKMLMGLCVVPKDGGKISVGIAFLRAVSFLLSTIPLGAGLLWALIDDQGRAWHDYLAMTRVVRVN